MTSSQWGDDDVVLMFRWLKQAVAANQSVDHVYNIVNDNQEEIEQIRSDADELCMYVWALNLELFNFSIFLLTGAMLRHLLCYMQTDISLFTRTNRAVRRPLDQTDRRLIHTTNHRYKNIGTSNKRTQIPQTPKQRRAMANRNPFSRKLNG